MNTVVAIVVIALMAVTPATAVITNCGTANMTATFNATSYGANPAPARSVTVTFSIGGVSSTPLTGVNAVVTTALVINGSPIPVDVRTIPCSNGGASCAFPPGEITVDVAQLIPGYTPSGDYQTTIAYVGTNGAGAAVTFGCILDAFSI